MAGPGQNSSAPLQVDTQSLVGRGPDTSVVSPAAVTALTDAFHRGFITADDVMERLSERTKQKQKLELATTNNQLAEANNPDIQAARTNVQLAQGAQAKGQLANAGLTQQADAAQKKAAILDADLSNGDYGAMNKALALQGFSVRINPEGVTDADRTEIGKRYGALKELTRQQAAAQQELDGTKVAQVPTTTKSAAGEVGGLVPHRTAANGSTLSKEQFNTIAQKNAVLKTTSLPVFYQLFSNQPGAVVQPATPTAQVVPAQPAAVATAPVQVTAPAPAAIGSTSPEGIFVTSTAAPPPGEAKATGALQERLNTLVSTDDTIAKARRLAVPGVVGPREISLVQAAHQAGAAAGIPGQSEKYTAQSELNTVIANEIANYVQDWKGAISDKELIFFKNARPRVDSTPEQWTSYLDEWAGKNARLKQIVAGQLPPADAAAWAANPRSQAPAAATPAGTPAAAATAAPATPSAAPVIHSATEAAAKPAGTIFRDADGNYRRRL